MRHIVLLAALASVAAVPAARAERLPLPLSPCRAPVAPADGPGALREYVGTMHEHSAYSDGFPGSIPTDYFRSGRCFGLDFLFAGEHSDTLALPIGANDECLPPNLPAACLIADPDTPQNNLTKWRAMAEQADAETGGGFVAARGFEWTSDRFGHINVYFSKRQTNAKADGGYAEMATFYAWARRAPVLGGGGDGLMTFNHPGDKKLSESDPGFNWNDFAYDPSVDGQMAGIELFNGTKEFGGFYTRALDRGWHVGAVGAEDKGHLRTDHWGADDLGKTVFLARRNTRAALRDAMAHRRMYATLGRGLRLDFSADGAVMGSRLRRTPGESLAVAGALRDWEGRRLDGSVQLDLVTNGGTVIASAAGDDLRVPVRWTPPDAGAAASRWLYLRASRAGRPVAFSSPIWIEPR